jgi:hypothetical protein
MIDAFDRVAPGYREAIGHAMGLIPEPIRDRLKPRFLTGIGPGFVGLHDAGNLPDWAGSQWTYNDSAHAGDIRHQTNLPKDKRRPTVVLPRPYREMCKLYWNDPGLTNTIIHELGHILDFGMKERPAVRAVSAYATNNQSEAFAEAFMFSVRYPAELQRRAPEAAAFFTQLAGVGR